MIILFRTIFFGVFGYLAVALVIPGVNFWDAAEGLFSPLYIDATSWIFHTFTDFFEHFRTMDTSHYNPAQDFINLLLMLGSIGCSLLLPVLWCVVITFVLWLSIYSAFPRVADGILTVAGGSDSSPEMENWKHIANGRTTIQDTYDADVQANAIAKALKK